MAALVWNLQPGLVVPVMVGHPVNRDGKHNAHSHGRQQKQILVSHDCPSSSIITLV